MSIPTSCTVLVIGGGPAGSYAATCLAREGVDVVLLEAEKVPRYHIGESTLPSMRDFLRFVDLEETFEKHGFCVKNGGAFRLSQHQPDTYTDFIKAGGPNGYAWNVVRSECDELLYKNAGANGAAIFDETKVDSVAFENKTETSPGTPVSAAWSRKDGSKGTVTFKYLVDCSGRQGLLSTKYLKNRKTNQNFKNVASWAYWETDAVYSPGTHKEGAPYFEAMEDKAGWVWWIPLSKTSRSIGVVQDQKLAADKKKAFDGTAEEFYQSQIDLAPRVRALLRDAEKVTPLKSASDWSYTASQYHMPNARICGDAGSFIDPLFSSGVHFAITGGLSAAVTIMASLKGELDEQQAGSWHTKKVVESYTRFFLTVSSATKQIRTQDEPLAGDLDEEGFQSAFDLLGPLIQGRYDTSEGSKSFQSDVDNVLKFTYRAFNHIEPEQQEALLHKLRNLGLHDVAAGGDFDPDTVRKHLTEEELTIVETLQGRRAIEEDIFHTSFSLNVIDGYAPRYTRGNLGLEKAEKAKINLAKMFTPEYLGHEDMVKPASVKVSA